jgi:hypothetical protein
MTTAWEIFLTNPPFLTFNLLFFLKFVNDGWPVRLSKYHVCARKVRKGASTYSRTKLGCTTRRGSSSSATSSLPANPVRLNGMITWSWKETKLKLLIPIICNYYNINITWYIRRLTTRSTKSFLSVSSCSVSISSAISFKYQLMSALLRELSAVTRK